MTAPSRLMSILARFDGKWRVGSAFSTETERWMLERAGLLETRVYAKTDSRVWRRTKAGLSWVLHDGAMARIAAERGQ